MAPRRFLPSPNRKTSRRYGTEQGVSSLSDSVSSAELNCGFGWNPLIGACVNDISPKTLMKIGLGPVPGFLLLAIAGLLVGCVSDRSSNQRMRVGNGVQEYRKLTAEAEAGVLEALGWLDRVRAHSNAVPAKVVAGFSEEVDKLQVGSLLVRARAQAIQARGKAWFDSWLDPAGSLTREQTTQVTKLHDIFVDALASSQATREAFGSFFSGLRALRVELAADPGSIRKQDTLGLIESTRAQGVEVVTGLGAVRNHLLVLEKAVESARTELKR